MHIAADDHIFYDFTFDNTFNPIYSRYVYGVRHSIPKIYTGN